MSLSDQLKFMRAQRGGVTPIEIETATGIALHELNYMEIKHRRVGEDEAILARLAAYYNVPLAELQFHRERFRKKLSAYLYQHTETGDDVYLVLQNQRTVSGPLLWWDRAVVAVEQPGAHPIIVERHFIVDWNG